MSRVTFPEFHRLRADQKSTGRSDADIVRELVASVQAVALDALAPRRAA